MLFVWKSPAYLTYEVLIYSCMCKRLSSNSLINIGKVNIHFVVYIYEFKITCFFRKRLTTYAYSRSIPYILNMRDCSFSFVSFFYNSNRDELQALIHSHTSTHSLFFVCTYMNPNITLLSRRRCSC